jgi:hypothetical protein
MATLKASPENREAFVAATEACGWRIVSSPMIPQDSPSCYHSSMRNLAILFIQFVATLARLL